MQNNIEKLRKERNWTRDFLAEKINMTGTAVYRHERGLRDIDTNTIVKYAKAFEVPPGEIIGKQKPLPIEAPEGSTYKNTPPRPLIARESSFPQFISEVEDKMYGYVIQYARDNHPNITAKELSEIASALIRLAEDTYGMTRMGSPQFVIDNFERIRREMKA